MRVVGLYADEAIKLLDSEQYVNVWDVEGHSFHCEATVGNLPEEVLEDLEAYFLEPTDELGRPVRVRLATGRG
jgi:hypothetical protein